MRNSIKSLAGIVFGSLGFLTLSMAANAASCPAWEATKTYTAGNYVKLDNQAWRAKWWNQNDRPGTSQWGPWESRPLSECTDDGGGGGNIPPEPTPTVGKHVGAYFVQWGIYQRGYPVRKLVDSGGHNKLTFLNYAFGNVYADGKCGMVTRAENGNGDGGDAWADYQKSFSAGESVDGVGDQWSDPLRGNFNQLRKLKFKNRNLKVLISLGGWTWSHNFGKFAATDAGRRTMVSSCIDLYIKGNLPQGEGAGGAGAAKGVFDGIDIDWEYPGGGGLPGNSVDPNDKHNFTLLLAEFRKQLDELGTQNKRKYYLTAAVGSGVDKIRNTEPAEYSKYLDWVNVMTYDFFGGWSATGPAQFQSHLYRDPAAPNTGDLASYNVADAIQTLVTAGIPKTKLNVGIPFYGRGWRGVAAGPNGNGLYQAATGAATGTYEPGIEDYKVLKQRNGSRYYHPVTKQLWLYDGNEFWSYDDPTVIATKLGYINQQGLAGAFTWSLDGDDPQGTLLNAVSALRGNGQ
ncbi:glycosyl hydrolase family 18 protein [Chitinivorax sp. B]|uniref:glycosyl hydrolase family 18 protein n=1 Tax=Chitinivorax sp. B TaxID=2502235 RepID=UPI0010F90D94|nr:glycosyl hydrolase family 18 protein [Chitinivorax sp. B]